MEAHGSWGDIYNPDQLALGFTLTGQGSFLSELDGRVSGKSLPGAEHLFLGACSPLSAPEQILLSYHMFEKMIGSNWDLHYYSLANHSANICLMTKH